MKKLLSLLLALTMVFALVSCGSAGAPAGSEPAPGPAASTSAEDKTPDAEVPVSDAEFEPMEISVSMSTNEVETPAKVFKVFSDYITEATGGAVTFKIFYGGTFCSPMEELYMLQSGALDMCILQTLAYGDVLPLMVGVPQMWIGTDEEAYNYFKTIFEDDPVTGGMIADALSAYNVKMVGNIYTGLNCWFSTKPFTSFEDLKGLKIGCQDSAPIDGLGLTAQFVDVGDYYDSLDRGVIDAGTFSFDGTVALKLYEPAPNVCLDQGKTWGMPFCIREDLWNTLSPELQQVFADAMSVAADYSVEQVNANIELAKENLSAEGVVINTLSDEDAAASFQAQIVASIASGMTRAKAAGCEEQMLTILNKSLELYGLNPSDYLSDYQ